jgi:exoribonuclease R
VNSVPLKLTGVVNECFPSHIGILVYSYFNAMVSADHLRAAGYAFDPDLQIWASEGGSETISHQDKINFEVDEVHEVEGAVSLEGIKPSLSLLVETE